MENVVDALKVAFAIIIFTLAITLAFSVISNIRQTSDVLFEISDTNKYYIDELEGYTYITATDTINRSVGAETIIPTIYRYYKENFGVTIMAENTSGILKPIVRFDLDTENIVNNWQTNTDETNEKHLDYLNTYVNPTILDVNDNNTNEEFWEEELVKEIYTVTKNLTKSTATPWIGSEKNILKRIKADIYGDEVDFNSTIYEGKNLLDEYLQKDDKYTEYFVFVPAEDINKTDKLEIIYVKE